MDLGRKMGDMGNALPAETEPETNDKIYYPSFYISNAPDEMRDIPDEGTATIRYKVTSRTVREDVSKDKKDIDVNIDVLSFDPDRPRPKPSPRGSPHDAVANSLRDFMLGRAQGSD
jgi:hypothetical protein